MSQNEVTRWCERARVELGDLQLRFDQATGESERQCLFREQLALIDYYVEWLSRSIDLQAALQAMKSSMNHYRLQPGDIVVYLLRPDQYPTNPLHEWRGRVIHYYPEDRLLIVEVLHEGFDHETEPVYFDQILRVKETREQPMREETIWYDAF